MEEQILALLNLSDVVIIDTAIDENGDFIITIKSINDSTACHNCGQTINTKNGHGNLKKIRHLPIFGRKCYIQIIPQIYQCSHCDGKPSTTERLLWCNANRRYTVEFEQYILLQLVNSTVEDVAVKEGLTCDEVSGIIDCCIDTEADWSKIEEISLIGIDEISRRKGHKDFLTVVTALVNGKIIVLAILEGRKKETIKKFLLGIPKKLRKTVKAVCCDMYSGYLNAAKEVFRRRVRITADRFHVARLYRCSIDKLRAIELKRLKKKLSPDEYKKLKGAMSALRKSPKELTKKDMQVLALLFKHSPELETAYILGTELTCIFDSKITIREARTLINAWMQKVTRSGLKCFDSFLVTLKTLKNQILNYFDGRNSSGFVEGLNNKIKVLKRRCYGIYNLGSWFQRLYIDLNGYDEFL